MNLERALNVDDLRRLAKRRLPKVLFDVIESGVEDELGLQRNKDAFRKHVFRPRYLLDVSERDQSATVFGRTYDSPFGIAPMGFGGLFRRGCEVAFAEAAAVANVPYIHSGVSITPLETVIAAAPEHVWSHIYPARDPAITFDYLARAAAAGVNVLVFTIDTPIYPKRERDIRSGFTTMKLRPHLMLEALLHPAWIAEYLRHGGTPTLGTWQRYAAHKAGAKDVSNFFRSQSPSVQTWRELDVYRAAWSGKFVVKGVLHPEDAIRCRAAGVDGLVVSNHGGKAYDALPAPLDVLPAIRAAVGDEMPVMVDGGIRRGSDILVARCLGADFAFAGRAMLYGAVAGGRPGAARALEILRDEVDRSLGLVGCPRFSDLDGRFLQSAT